MTTIPLANDWSSARDAWFRQPDHKHQTDVDVFGNARVKHTTAMKCPIDNMMNRAA